MITDDPVLWALVLFAVGCIVFGVGERVMEWLIGRR